MKGNEKWNWKRYTKTLESARFEEIDSNAEYNQLKVIAAMQKNRVSDIHFSGTTGYGYNDLGRETLEQVYADVFHTEDALVRPQITCGTHALYTAICARVMNFCHQSENHTTRWRKSSASGRRTVH